MPLVNAQPSTGMAEAYGRPAPVAPTTQGNVTPNRDAAAQTAPAGAGPAAVVQISEAARSLSVAGSNPAAEALANPGLNNGTMAAEGGSAAELRSLLASRYDAQEARLNEEAR